MTTAQDDDGDDDERAGETTTARTCRTRRRHGHTHPPDSRTPAAAAAARVSLSLRRAADAETKRAAPPTNELQQCIRAGGEGGAPRLVAFGECTFRGSRRMTVTRLEAATQHHPRRIAP